MIFKTERLLIRKLHLKDLQPFHEMESNANVLKYATGFCKSYHENEAELKTLIYNYNTPDNNFYIYAIQRKIDQVFVGTIALVKDGIDDEIGYRFLEKFWGNGYGFEACEGVINYCKKQGKKKLVGYVVDKNHASKKILLRLNFKAVKHFVSEDCKLPETKFVLYL